jgi:predicted phage tail protein
MYFANSNVVNGEFNYTETAKNLRYTSVEVVYNDKFDNFKTKIEFIEDVDGIRTFGFNPFKVNAAGCTSRSEARRIGRYILHSSMFEADTVAFTAGLEGAYLQPGDIFAVSDELKNVARTFGRILSANGIICRKNHVGIMKV